MAFRCLPFIDTPANDFELVMQCAQPSPALVLRVRRAGVPATDPYVLEYDSFDRGQLVFVIDDQLRALPGGWYDGDVFVDGKDKPCATFRFRNGAVCPPSGYEVNVSSARACADMGQIVPPLGVPQIVCNL